MSAGVTEKTKRGEIQFQKLQRFFRGQWPRRFARTSGERAQPTAAGFNRPCASHRSTAEVISRSSYVARESPRRKRSATIGRKSGSVLGTAARMPPIRRRRNAGLT